MREFILNQKAPFSLPQLIYDWPEKPVYETLMAEVLSDLIAEGKVVSRGIGYRGIAFYEVVK